MSTDQLPVPIGKCRLTSCTQRVVMEVLQEYSAGMELREIRSWWSLDGRLLGFDDESIGQIGSDGPSQAANQVLTPQAACVIVSAV